MVTSVLLLAALQPAHAATRRTSNFNSLQDALNAVNDGDVLIIDGNPVGGALGAEGIVTAPAVEFVIEGGAPAGGILEFNWNGSTIYVPPGGDLTLSGISHTCNFSPVNDFPAVSVDGIVRIENSTFECFLDGVVTVTDGGSILEPASGASNTTFAYNDNVISAANADQIVLNGMEFENNYRSGTNTGSVVSIVNANRVEVVNADFEANIGSGGAGSSLYVSGVDSTLIESSTFRYNSNFEYIDLNAQFDPFDDNFDESFFIASGKGGAVYIEGNGGFGEELEMLGNVFDGNIAWEGGAVYVENIRYANFYNNLLVANWAVHLGGGLMTWIDDNTQPWGEDYRWPAEESEGPNYDLLPADDGTPGGGGGAFGDGHKVVNNTFVLNTAGVTLETATVVVFGGGGGALFHGHRPDFRNNIVSHTNFGGGVLLHDGVNFIQGDDLKWENNLFYWNCDGRSIEVGCAPDDIDIQTNVTSNGHASGYTLAPSNVLETDPLYYYVGDLIPDVPNVDFDGYPDVYCTQFESLAVRGGDPLEEQESSIAVGQAPYSDIGMCGGQLAHLYWNRDRDGDGFEQFYDCLDEPDEPESIETFPGAQEDCDFVDNDCDGVIDEGFVTTWYNDVDGDGFGDDTDLPMLVCPSEAPIGAVSVGGDCDDALAAVNEGATEICDGIDNDCDDIRDQGDLEYITVFRDGDGDGYGAVSAPREACFNSTTGAYYEAVGTDSVPLAGANWVADALDCDDSDPTVNPDAVEDCTIADRNCNGDSYDADGAPEYFIDFDADGYGQGNPNEGTRACEPEQLEELAEGTWVPQGQDCDETNAGINPGAAEICDGFDNDCDTRIDIDPEDAQLLYEDYDNDGYGNPATALRSCDPGPTYTTSKGGDCDDADPSVGECAECGCQATPSPAGSGAMLVLMASLLGLRRRRS